jgi:hypothetical protein
MQLRYDEDLIEAAVFLRASGRCKGIPSLQIARFHRERERLYQILNPDERNTAFFRLHLEWFREWGLEQPLTNTLKEFTVVGEKLTFLAIRKTTVKKEEGAELYVNESGDRTGLLALRLERFADDSSSLEAFLRHEFTHLHDMLDPLFGYNPVLELPGLNAAQRRLATERYRLLWDITIDGRLAFAGWQPMTAREQHEAAFARGYCFWPESRRGKVFETLWHNRATKHSALLGFITDPRGLRQTSGPAPGASCPLCDFPTFVWAQDLDLRPEIINRVAAEFPGWTSDQGLCKRCLETYEAVAALGAKSQPGCGFLNTTS